MPAPSPLKKHTAVVQRLMKDEEYYFKDYYNNDAAQIEKAKAAIEDKELEGNKASMMDQTVRKPFFFSQPRLPCTPQFSTLTSIVAVREGDAKLGKDRKAWMRHNADKDQTRAQQETLITYHTLFGDNKIADATEKLWEELEKAKEGEVDEAVEKEIEVAREVLEEAQKLIDAGPRLLKEEAKK